MTVRTSGASVAHREVRAELERVQWLKLSRLLEYAYERSLFYRRRFDEAGVQPAKLRSLADFRSAVPLMRKEDVLADQRARPPFGERLSVDPRQVVQAMITGGTSGAGQEVYGLTPGDVAAMVTTYGEGVRWAGARRGDVAAMTFPMSMSGAPMWIYGACVGQHLTVLPVGPYDTATKLRFMRDFGARLLFATPSYLQVMAAEARNELGWDPATDLGVEVLLTATESFSVERARRIEEDWGAKLFEWYGSSQRALAWTCEHGAVREDGSRGLLHHFPHAILLETLDPATHEPVEYGEEGEAVVTFLDAEASPLVRFASGDRVVLLPAESCPCGKPSDGYEAGAISRYDDMLKVRGINIWPSTIDEILLAQPIVSNYVGIVMSDENGRERISVEVEFMPEAPAEERAEALRRYEANLRSRIGLRMELAEASGPLPRFDDPRRKARRWRDERAK